ncbi:MAG: divergent PAP2 family protein [Eubacterium sp.]|nr:divergent PAP2 family protein [Eubacterium sp.]
MKDVQGFFMDLITNKVLISALLAWAVAQVSKVLLDVVKGSFTVDRLTGSGGMPSSHSATSLGLITATALTYGVGGFEFPMAFFFGIIVIYDAMGVRMETGREAQVLNKLRERDLAEGKEPLFNKPLREKIGHTLPEIIVGGLIGIAAALIVCLAILA